jgi:hypothetical protein
MSAIDPADDATKKSEGHLETDYIKYLKRDGLQGARIGLARDVMGQDPDVDWVVEAEFNGLRPDGAGPNPNRWTLMKREAGSGGLDDYRYTVARDHALPMV